MIEPLRFILQAIDPDLGHPSFETMFTVERPEKLRSILGEAASEDPDLDFFYTLEPEELTAINQAFGISFDPQGRTICLYKWTRHRRQEVPYLIHTGYELALMVDGRKPLTWISMEYPPLSHHNESRFDHYVAEGMLHKEVELEPFSSPHQMKSGRVLEGIRSVYYTLKGEEWRIAAWKLVYKASTKGGWNNSFERLQGMLLGYADWQNDWWIDDIRRREREFGTLLAYIVVTPDQLAAIEHSAFRAMPMAVGGLRIAVSLEAEDDKELQLLKTAEAPVLVKVRIKARQFFDLVGFKQATRHELPADRIKDLNRAIVGEIEVISR